MKKITLCVALTIALLLNTAVCGEQVSLANQPAPLSVVYTSARDDSDRRDYFVEALRLALTSTQAQHGTFEMKPTNLHMNQKRQIFNVVNGKADVMWTMTTDERETLLLPVRFPLLGGLAGFRVFVIHPAHQSVFTKDKAVDRLRQLTAVQGANWPDTKILRHNGFQVETVDWGNWYDNLFNLVRRQHADYFPRGVIEAPLEVSRLNDPNLVIERNHALIYPAYMYFFVHQDNTALADRLETGLALAFEQGKLQALFDSFPHHVAAKQLLQQSARARHPLTNPFVTRHPDPKFLYYSQLLENKQHVRYTSVN